MLTRFRNEEGAVAIIVALSLIAIVGIVAIVTDGGNIYRERSSAQNAADHAAMAAAWAACDPDQVVDWDDAGLAAADENGYDNDGTTNTVTMSIHTDGVMATIDTTIATNFGAALGEDSLDTVASAVATCTIGGDGYAIFADGTSCGNSVNLSGADGYVKGGVHTNDDLNVSGSNHTLIGNVTYVGKAPKNAAGKIDYLPRDPLNPSQSPIKIIPSHDVDDYLPGGAYHDASAFFDAGSDKIDMKWLKDNGYIDADGVMTSGIYYSDTHITINNNNLFPDGIRGNVTLVSQGGEIQVLAGNTSVLTAYAGPFNANGDLGMLAITERDKNPQCQTSGIHFSGSEVAWEGILYAPTSKVTFSISSSSTFAGQILGYSVQISASDSTLTNPNDQDKEGFVALMH